MTQRVVHRPARLALPALSVAPLELATPPVSADTGAGLGGVTQVMLPAMGAGGSLVMILANKNPLMLVAGGIMIGVMVIGGIIAFVAQRTGAAKRAGMARVRYIEYLEDVKGELGVVRRRQREVAAIRHPAPSELPELIREPTRLWERRRHDADFLVVRIGTGGAEMARPIKVGPLNSPLAQPEPLAAAAIDRLRTTTRHLDEMPLAVPLTGVVSLVADPAGGRAALRAMVLQLAVLHAPDDVRIGLCIGAHAGPDFEWVKWLPHLISPDRFDGPVGQRLVARTGGELHQILGPEVEKRHAFLAQQRKSGSPTRIVPTPRLVLIADQITAAGFSPIEMTPEGTTLESLGITVVTVVEQRESEPSHVDVRITVEPGRAVRVDDLRAAPSGPHRESEDTSRREVAGATEGTLDDVAPALAERVARQLAPLRLVEDAALEAPLEATIDLAGLVGVADVGTYDVQALWAPRLLPDFLRVPFGLDGAAQRVMLDLKESAQSGMGPHGLCVGATGSGKSEVLRTVVLTMAMTHPPDRLSFVLVDYKGGATFANLGDLPHTAAMVSNLSDDTGLVDRLHDAILGEIERRQQVLQDAGSLPNTFEYNARRDAGYDLAPLPNLFVVIDEFGEMLSAKPDFIELFLRIGRIGRSIGVHLLLASQRLEEGRLRGLESYLSYRLGLRTFNAQESRAVLGVPDAHELPPIPGSGFLKVDPDLFQRFKAAYVSGTYQAASTDEAVEALPAIAMPYALFNDTAAWLSGDDPNADAERSTATPTNRFAPTVLETVVTRLKDTADQVSQIWLPPLPAAVALNRVLGPLRTDDGNGLTVDDASRRSRLRIPIGLLDRPAEQWQGPLELDLSAGAGHVAVMGAPQSGRSTLLRTIVTAAALTHTPADVAFYCLDLGGGGLNALSHLPHIGGVASRIDADRVQRTVAEIASALTEREQVFAEHRFDSTDAMRVAHRAGRVPELAVADIFLVIDNWTVLKEDFEDLTETVQEIGNRGLGYGIHLIISTGRWADFRLPIQSIIGTKLELRLNDALDSTISRKAVENISADTPGRVACFDGLIAQICLPRIDDVDDPNTAQEGLDTLVKQVAEAWPGAPVPEIRMLPNDLQHASLRRAHPDDRPVLIGVDEAALRPVRLDLFGADQHLVVFGDASSGKTSLARTIINELVAHYTDEQVVFALFDLRRTLLDVVPEPYRGGYAGAPNVAAGLGAGLAKELSARLPPDDVTTTQLRERSWWKGPEIVVIADDYDLLSPAGAGPLAPLLEYLPQSRDIGLHVVLLRRSGGAGRAIHEPVPQRLKELGATALLLSGERQEGQLWPGAHMATQPPGRGLLIRRGEKPERMQLAYTPGE